MNYTENIILILLKQREILIEMEVNVKEKT